MNLQPHPAPLTRINRWWIIGPGLVLSLAASFFYFVVFPGTAFGNSFYTGIKVWLLAAPVAVTTLLFRERLARLKPEPGNLKKSLIVGTLFGLATVAAMFALIEWSPLGETVRGGTANIKEAIKDLGVDGPKFIYFAFFISLIHSALEEFYWRWFMYGNLRHMVNHRWWAHLLAGGGFMAHHIVIVDRFFPLSFAIFLGLCVGFGGIVWSWLYQRYHTLWGPWLSHAIVDFGIFWIGYKLISA